MTSILKTNMTSLESRFKKKNETRNYLLEEIKHNDLMIEKHKNTCKYLTSTGCVSISAFTSLVAIPVSIKSSAERLNICAIIAGVKKYKSVINKMKKRHDKIVLLGKTKLDTIKVLILKVLIDLYISNDEFVSVNNALRVYDEMKEEIKNPKTSVEQTI